MQPVINKEIYLDIFMCWGIPIMWSLNEESEAKAGDISLLEIKWREKGSSNNEADYSEGCMGAWN